MRLGKHVHVDLETEFGGEEGEEGGLELGVRGRGCDGGEVAPCCAGGALAGVALFWEGFRLRHLESGFAFCVRRS